MKKTAFTRFFTMILCTSLAVSMAPLGLYAGEVETEEVQEVQEEVAKSEEEETILTEPAGEKQEEQEDVSEPEETGTDLEETQEEDTEEVEEEAFDSEQDQPEEELEEELSEEADEFADAPEDFQMTLPTVYLHIDGGQSEVDKMNGSDDHSYRCTGTMDITVPEGFSYTDQGKALSSVSGLKLEYIRGRGNSTWGYDKKPYKFKLAKKSGLLGMGSNKHWALIANALDPSMMRNRITLWLGRQLGLSFTPSGYPVDLFMEGEYLGSYLLCEVVRVDDNRVEIDELDASDTSYSTITGGYLIQNQQDVDSPAVFSTEKGELLQNVEPSFDPGDDGYNNETQKNYIRNYIQEAEYSINEGEIMDEEAPSGYRSLDYHDYFDLDSAAYYWLVQEFSKNTDAYKTGSTYFYKTRDSGGTKGRIYYGPLWDFDFGWDYQSDPEDNDGMGTFATEDPWMTALMSDKGENSFYSRVQKKWPEVRSLLHQIADHGGMLDRYSDEIRASWSYSDEAYPARDQNDNHVSFENAIETLRSWILRRIRHFDAHIGELDEYSYKIAFKSDSEDEHPVVHCYRRGYFISTMPSPPEKEGFLFDGWYNEDGKNVYDVTAEKEMVFTARFIAEDEAVRADTIFFKKKDDYVRLSDGGYMPQYTLLPENAHVKDLTWESSDPSIAEASEYGNINFLKTGTVTITANLPDGSSDSFTLHILDNLKPLTDASLDCSPLYLLVGENAQATVTVEPADSDYSLDISIEDDEIADVDFNGVVTGKKAGRTKRFFVVSPADGDEERTIILEQEIIVSEKEGTLTTDVRTTGIEGSCDELEEKSIYLITANDLANITGGADAQLWLEMTRLKEGKVPASDKKALTSYLEKKNLQKGLWLDISLFKKVGEITTQLHETEDPLSFTVKIPVSLQNKEDGVTRTFFLLKIHDGKVTEVSSAADVILTEKSREFSTYLLAYSDKGKSKGKENQKDGKGKNGKKSDGSVNTGDESNMTLFLILGGISLVCAASALYFGFRKKH